MLTYLLLLALVLLLLIAASHREGRVGRLKSTPGTHPLRSGLSKEKVQNAGALRQTGTGP